MSAAFVVLASRKTRTWAGIGAFLLALSASGSERPAGEGPKAIPGVKRMAVPVYGAMLELGMPAGWKLAHEEATKAQYIAEFIPAGQRLDDWQDMITVQGFRGLGEHSGLTGKIFLRRIAEGFNRTCPGQVLGFGSSERQIDGRPAALALLGCAKLSANFKQPWRSEYAVYIAVTAGPDLVLIQKARRGPALPLDRSPLQGAELESFLAPLQPIKLCSRSAANPRCP